MPPKTPPETLEKMNKSQKIQIHFITGKGGVGKSTIAAACALKSANEGKRTLLVELGHQSFFQDFFSITEVGYKPLNLRKNLDISLWSGTESLKEYARYLLKIESLYRLFFENPVSRALVNVAPALPEIAVLGKITSGPPRFVGPDLPYDSLVIDTYATGHFLSLLRAPKGMSAAIQFGPMGEQSRSIERVIADPTICRYSIVSLPEEMPVMEATELSQTLNREFQIEPVHILNKIFPSGDGKGSAAFEDSLREMENRKQQAIQMLKGRKVLEMPFIFENQSWKLIEALALKLSLNDSEGTKNVSS